MQNFQINKKDRRAFYFSKEEGEAIEYRKEMFNQFTHLIMAGGYFLIVKPVTVEKTRDDLNRSVYVSTDRGKLLNTIIKRSKRYSKNTLQKIAKEYDNKVPQLIEEYSKIYNY